MILAYILGGLAVIIILFVIVAAMQPAEYRVVRTGTISAPPAEVFPQVNDLHEWEAWSPWAKLDPTMKQTYEGAPQGTGAIYSWNGNMYALELSERLGLEREGGFLRLGLVHYNTADDVERTLKALDELHG